MKKTFKRILAVALVIVMVLALVPATFAASKNLATDKTEYLAGESIKVTISGLSSDQLDNQSPWVGVFTSGKLTSKGAYNGLQSFVGDLDDGKTWTINAPNELGTYDIRLITNVDGKDSDIDSLTIKVVSNKAKAGDVKINKSSFLASDKATVTITGLTSGQIDNGAWAGIFVQGVKVDGDAYNGMWTWIKDLDDGKTWNFDAPRDSASYEVRIYTANPDPKDRNSVLFATIPFTVGSSKASAGDVKLSNSTFLPSDPATLTIAGITQGQLDNGAWAGIFLKGDKIDADSFNGQWTWVKDLSDSKTWKFKVPADFGFYEIRVFTANPDPLDRGSCLYATVPFSVKGNLAKTGDLSINKTEFKMGEPITVTFKPGCLTAGQLADGAWAGLFLPKDDMKTDQYAGVWTYVSDLRDGKTWKFNAPMEPGFYEIRVFSKNTDANNREPAYFGKLTFKVDTLEQKAGYKFSVTPATVTLVKGKTLKLDVRATPLTGGRTIPANNMVTFTSRNVKIATVSTNGTIKAIGFDHEVGVTYIDIKYGTTIIKSIKVTVKLR